MFVKVEFVANAMIVKARLPNGFRAVFSDFCRECREKPVFTICQGLEKLVSTSDKHWLGLYRPQKASILGISSCMNRHPFMINKQ